ncbi:MAG: hypothetical protein JSS10_00990 [Verrucomicrobia bacterium]|nr:hypothetical protein [Verrucomicrobiota bacterium]
MKIKIAERLKPFSHLPGASCVIPWSSWKVQAYPELLKFENLTNGQKLGYRLDWKGPVLDFTVELDLEKGAIWVYGHTEEGYRRLCIETTNGGIAIDKKVIVPTSKLERPLERLSLGMSKSLDWQLVRRRHEMAEILPVWFRLGQMVPASSTAKVGAAALLQECEKTEVVKHYLKIFLAGFEGILTPRLSDTDHQGIIPEGEFSESPLILLTEGAQSIRSLFFREMKDEWSFLPCLSPDFHAGRYLQLQTKAGDRIDFEWSKKSLQKVIIDSKASREIFIGVPKPLTSCRLRTSLHGKGVRHSLNKPLALVPSQTFFLDRFEK